MFVFFYHILPVCYLAFALFGVGILIYELVKRLF
jgi:hypothetical protein